MSIENFKSKFNQFKEKMTNPITVEDKKYQQTIFKRTAIGLGLLVLIIAGCVACTVTSTKEEDIEDVIARVNGASASNNIPPLIASGTASSIDTTNKASGIVLQHAVVFGMTQDVSNGERIVGLFDVISINGKQRRYLQYRCDKEGQLISLEGDSFFTYADKPIKEFIIGNNTLNTRDAIDRKIILRSIAINDKFSVILDNGLTINFTVSKKPKGDLPCS